MTAAVLISMIFSFFVGQPSELVPDDPAKSAQQIIEMLDSLKLELTRDCPLSLTEFVAARAELKKADLSRSTDLIN